VILYDVYHIKREKEPLVRRYKQTGKEIVLLLCGGNKATQDKDIKRAKEIAAEL
jgi:putative addiction module killer protein